MYVIEVEMLAGLVIIKGISAIPIGISKESAKDLALQVIALLQEDEPDPDTIESDQGQFGVGE